MKPQTTLTKSRGRVEHVCGQTAKEMRCDTSERRVLVSQSDMEQSFHHGTQTSRNLRSLLDPAVELPSRDYSRDSYT